MNIIRMTGGLGNQMFQYALYLKLKAQGKEVKLDDQTEYEGREARPLLLWVFGIEYPRATREEINEITDGFMYLSHRIRRKLFGRRTLEYHEADYNFDEQVLLREPAYLTGYFQSEKYFADIEAQVRAAFQFSERMWEEIPESLRQRIREYQEGIENQTSISVHIRRGDYLEKDEIYGGICTEAYYQKAIAFMKEKYPQGVFYLFSNDPEWVRDWAAGELLEKIKFEVVEGTTEDTGYLDLFLMSRCKAHIIANSSFSWWGAWLNPNEEKTVIAPGRWNNVYNMHDIYTEEMIRM